MELEVAQARRVQEQRSSPELLTRVAVAVEKSAAQILTGEKSGEEQFQWLKRCMFGERILSQHYAERILRIALHIDPKMLAGEMSDDDLQGIVDKYVSLLAVNGL